MNRRDLLHLLGLGAGSLLAGAAVPLGRGREQPTIQLPQEGTAQTLPASGVAQGLPFDPVTTPLPLATDGLSAAEQQRVYRQISLQDALVVPQGYRAELLASWGDPLADGRFGFNNDYLAFIDLGKGRALLTVNFEYISVKPWGQGYAEVVGQRLPLPELQAAMEARGGQVDLAALLADDPLRRLVLTVARGAMADLGIGVCTIERQPDGGWRRVRGRHDRRITGLNGQADPAQRLRVSGPAVAVFRRRSRLGYDDGLADRVIGSFANCAGGQTPWGTVLSAEENYQLQVVDAVFADGSSPAPAERPFQFDGQRLEGLGNPFGLAGNKYGWMVEVDPRHPERTPVKHSWLGRFRHEAVAVKADRGQPLIVYSGCDRYGGHLYRYVSDGAIGDPSDPLNSRLLERGRLQVARFEPGGGGRWIPLDPATPLNPQRPSHFERFDLSQPTRLPHSDRRRAGAEVFHRDGEVEAYCQRYRSLGDLYPGGGEEQMGAILIDAHLAANAVGATPTARPEDTELDPASGDLLIAFTAAGSDAEGAADPAIFQGPAGEPAWPHGWVMRLQETSPSAGGGFSWRMVATGGLPWQGGMGFSNPDNLAIDRAGNLWMVTDRSSKSEFDIYGHNSCWVLPAQGPAAGEALCFATGPSECELCGPCFDAEETTFFLAIQHPGEDNGTRSSEAGVAGSGELGAVEAQAHSLVDRDGQTFEQLRWVPRGSNWPSGVPGRTPRPGVVAIRRQRGGPLL